MASRPPVAVLHAPGTNRDGEAALALEVAGADARIVLLVDLASGRDRLERYAGVVVPGGFSYGDALGAGTRLALEAGEALRAYADAEDGARPVLGICNGFQALVRSGLLGAGIGPDAPRRATLTANAGGRFECRWVTLEPQPSCTAAWVGSIGHLVACPVAHGEGRLAVRGPEVEASLAAEGLVAFRYVDHEGAPAGRAYPANPNGSAGDIAGLSNAGGNVVGLMPHPEDHVLEAQDAFRGRRPGRLGRTLFERFVARARGD
ncbi:MAG: phosphoribosylformylglycinamidine synthase [Acidimicrobiia bacterium]|nr:phosphoribosylformylglycinamidine synthase [Acidimicrobiia bacterium]